MSGIGILQVRKRPARMGRNPATGETIARQRRSRRRSNQEAIRDVQEQVSALEKLIRTAKEAVVRTKKLLDQLAGNNQKPQR